MSRGPRRSASCALGLSLALAACASKGAASAPTEANPDAGVGSSAPAPRLIDSFPLANATDVYPSPFGDGRQSGFELRLEFSTAMDRRVNQLPFGVARQTKGSLPLHWSGDGSAARLLVAPPPFAAQSLLDDTRYELDLQTLRGADGKAVAFTSSLPDGKLRFETGRYDALLNHSCAHTLFGPFASGSALPTPSADGPITGLVLDTTHTQYTIDLPLGQTSGPGYVFVRLAPAGVYRLYLDREVQLSEHGAETARAIEVTRSPDSCPGIVAQADLSIAAADSPEGNEKLLQIDAGAHPRVGLIVEATLP